MKKVLLFLFMVVATFSYLSEYAYADAGWDSNHGAWKNRINVTVNNTLSYNLTNNATLINLTYRSGMCNTFCDLNMTWYNRTSGGQQNISYWKMDNRSYNGSYAEIFINAPFLERNVNETIYIYFNNSAQVNDSNPDATMIFADDFRTLNFSGKWNTTQPQNYSAYVSNSTMTMRALTNSSHYIQSLISSIPASRNHTWEISFLAGTTDSTYIYRKNVTGGAYDNGQWFGSMVAPDGKFHYIYRTTAGSMSADIDTGISATATDRWRWVHEKNGTNTVTFKIIKNETLVYSALKTDVFDTILYESYFAWTGDDVYVPYVYTRDYIQTEPSTTFGATENFTSAPPVITIINPTNTTYFVSYNFNFTFSITDDNTSILNVSAFLDNVLVYSNTSFNNGATVTFQQNVTDLKQYNFTVYANDSTTVGSTTVFFTVDDLQAEPVNKTFDYETNTTNYTLLLKTNFDLVASATSTLVWNGTSQGIYDTTTSNSTYIIQRKNVTIPLILTNNTAVNFSWIYNYTYINGSVISSQTTANQSTALWFAYYLVNPSQVQNDTNPIENDIIHNNLTVTAILQNAVLSANTSYRGTNYTMTNLSYTLFQAILNVGNVTSTNETFAINSSLLISFDGRQRSTISESDSITVHKIILTDCGTITTTRTLNFFLKDEETDVDVNGTIRMNHNVSNGNLTRNYGFLFSNITNATICINPAFANYTIDSFIVYEAALYSTRTYFLQQQLTNLGSQTM